MDAGPNNASLSEQAVFVKSQLPDGFDRKEVHGYDFNKGIDYDKIIDSYLTTGFQATHLGKAISEINNMLSCRFLPLDLPPTTDPCFSYPESREKRSLTIFLGYTSNLVTSGLRDVFRYLAQHDLIDCIVTSAGGIEEDFVKCLKPTLLGSFKLSGSELRKHGINRAGNLLIPNENYCAFEDWLMPILDECLLEQKEQDSNFNWTPSKLIHRLGKEINNEESIYFWCYKNKIPVFCPALTDGSLGDMLYFHSVRNSPGIRLDIVEDLKFINTLAVKSSKTGVIILGGGVAKHHINNANLMRNGSDFTVYINTSLEFDGSDSGAEPDEAVSWGKIKGSTNAVKVTADATLVFPLIVAKTFAKYQNQKYN